MPKILELKEIDGELWCRVGTPPDFESGAALWTPGEQRENYQAGLKRAAEICGDHNTNYQNRREMLPEDDERALVERGILIACSGVVKKLEQAILKEIEGETGQS